MDARCGLLNRGSLSKWIGKYSASVLSRGFWWVCGYCSSQATSAQAILENLKCLSLRIPQCREENPRNGVRKREGGLEIEKVLVLEIGRGQARDRFMVT